MQRSVRRTVWLVLSPWLVVAVSAAVGTAVALVLVELLTTGEDGLGDLGGVLMGFLGGAIVAAVGSIALLTTVAMLAFPTRVALAAVGGAVGVAVVVACALAVASGLLDVGSASWAVVGLPVVLPAAGTVAFLLADRAVHRRERPAAA